MHQSQMSLEFDQKAFLELLHHRFLQNMIRHETLVWPPIEKRLLQQLDKLASLFEMESSGGEPDVIGYEHDEYLFVDCSPESPVGRRSLCYDQEALDKRKNNPPAGSALSLAAAMGLEVLDEEEYRRLQRVGVFDTKSSSWLRTPFEMRKKGGALFGDRRYDRVFAYHNGADSYYASRGFRGLLRV
ncbi:MAG: DUF4256 domain-containing protein [Sphaerochaeta sp.]